MVGPKKLIGYRLKRLLAPTIGLHTAVFKLVIGSILFIAGFTLSFKHIIQPFSQALAESWNNFVLLFVSPENLDLANHLLGGLMLLLGSYFLFKGIRRVLRRLLETFAPGLQPRAGWVYIRRQQLAQGPRIVALGGGTGLSTLLRGLKQHSSNITAIVTVTDDGGSSGRLVQEMGIVPPGDLRNCLAALADAEKVVTDLFQHRFKSVSGSLSGHSIGNLFIAALVEQCGGDFQKALNLASEVMAIRGRVIPSTLSPTKLKAEMQDGSIVYGETSIVQSAHSIKKVFLDPSEPSPHPEVLEAIKYADLICIGPGSVYTSVIPNLLVPGIKEAISDSTAVTAYICNVMTQHGETDKFTASEHAKAIENCIDSKVFDYMLINTGIPSPSTLEKYRESDQFLVEPDIDKIRAMNYKPVTGNFMSESDYVRHDPLRVAARLMQLLNIGN